MKIKELRYTRVYNLGNYQTAKYEVVAEVNDGEAVCFKPLAAEIERQYAEMFHPEQQEKNEQTPEHTDNRTYLSYSEEPNSNFQKIKRLLERNALTMERVGKFYIVDDDVKDKLLNL